MKKILILIFIIIWIFFAISPYDRVIWFAENLLIFFMFPTVLYLDMKYNFSNIAFFLLFLFAIFHIIGAHFTYNDVPYFTFEIFGEKRNYYDRIVHFLFGLLVFPSFFEIYYHQKYSKNLSLLIAFLYIASISAAYEIAEWIVVDISHSGQKGFCLITQGDVWDSQKDMASAMIGAFLSLLIYKFLGNFNQKTF
ncbi:DUF2238 domain-containing protein [Nitrosophilus kaiyonis]|uniref:DUF2238 domain-containing protein n=1 Tax=Nitrosophilus kaiyonis TaxID=2930200 RepID=UPI002492FF85|nr:DUF2238 domain-containing protein [Nitrosophilus kaiyonis]